MLLVELRTYTVFGQLLDEVSRDLVLLVVQKLLTLLKSHCVVTKTILVFDLLNLSLVKGLDFDFKFVASTIFVFDVL
jgi:hypothetical protein